MYERLKHLIINADVFREKLRMGHYPRVEQNGKENSQNKGKQPGGFKLVKDRRCNSGKNNKHTRTQRNNLRSGSTLVKKNDFGLVYWIWMHVLFLF